MKRCLITGAHGFIGQNLARYLAREGRTVIGLGHGAWPQFADIGLSDWLNGEVDGINLDTLAATNEMPRTIFHLAGGSLVSSSFKAPLEDYRRTVDTTSRLLDWVRDKSPDSALVYVSSAAVYGSRRGAASSETQSVHPQSPYGAHKLMAETLCRSYAEHFGVKVAIVRFFSLFGPGLRKQLLWEMCTRLERGEDPVTLGGTGDEQRDWMYIGDAVRLLTIAGAVADTSCPIINGGTGIATSVCKFAQEVAAAWGAQPPLFSGSARTGDPDTMVADMSFAQSIGFHPNTELKAGIRNTVNWFREAVPTTHTIRILPLAFTCRICGERHDDNSVRVDLIEVNAVTACGFTAHHDRPAGAELQSEPDLTLEISCRGKHFRQMAVLEIRNPGQNWYPESAPVKGGVFEYDVSAMGTKSILDGRVLPG